MPEIPRWLIVVIVAAALVWGVMQAVQFAGKLGNTVDKANSSINSSQQNIQSVGSYE